VQPRATLAFFYHDGSSGIGKTSACWLKHLAAIITFTDWFSETKCKMCLLFGSQQKDVARKTYFFAYIIPGKRSKIEDIV